MARSSRHAGRAKAASGPAGLSGSPSPAALADATIEIAALTRLADLATHGPRPFRAFTIGALINPPLAHAPSAIVFSDDPARI